MAAEQGVRLCEFLTEAVRAKLAVTAKASDKPWMNLRGRLKHLHEETKHISRLIDENSARIDPEVWSRSQTHATGQRYGLRGSAVLDLVPSAPGLPSQLIVLGGCRVGTVQRRYRTGCKNWLQSWTAAVAGPRR